MNKRSLLVKPYWVGDERKIFGFSQSDGTCAGGILFMNVGRSNSGATGIGGTGGEKFVAVRDDIGGLAPFLIK